MISVVIPVFNAAPFVESAVRSALAQPETGEVILVDDGSTDGSLEICEHLVAQFAQVRLLRHANGENRGAGAARNLGIEHAVHPLVAFLDADDIFLPGRFRGVIRTLEAHPDADGVYDAVGMIFEDEAAHERWEKANWPEVLRIRDAILPEQLFESLARGGSGAFCTDGIVLRRELLQKSGNFNTRLRTGQDTHLWVRLAAVGRLYSSDVLSPVAMARVHSGNRVTGRPRQLQYAGIQQVWGDLLKWAASRKLSAEQRRALARRYVSAANGRVSQQRVARAVGIALAASAILLWRCPQPWKVGGFAHLVFAATGVGLIAERLFDFMRMQQKSRSGVTS